MQRRNENRVSCGRHRAVVELPFGGGSVLAWDEMVDERDTWRALLEGNTKAWDDAVIALFRRVRLFFLNKVGDKADELTQRTFRRLLEVRASYRGGNPRSYVLGIAKCILFEHMRELHRDRAVTYEEVSVAALDPRPSSLLAAKATHRVMLEALRRLPLASQIILELYYWEGMNDREIAEVLEGNANTIRGRHRTARQQLRQIIEELEAAPALASTSMDLERWAQSVKEGLDLSLP